MYMCIYMLYIDYDYMHMHLVIKLGSAFDHAAFANVVGLAKIFPVG